MSDLFQDLVFQSIAKSQTVSDLLTAKENEPSEKSQSLMCLSKTSHLHVGLLLCTEYGQEMVEYLAPNIDPNLFVAQYELQLPSKDKVKEFLISENRA